MKIAALGPGAVGGYFGARLAEGGADVTFVAGGARLAATREQRPAISGGPERISSPAGQCDGISLHDRASG